ncbi:DUF3800 domain-containing protein [Stigmatella hybrida]|uniref:DUF3800 domain-containing protein n=1 Tax=Stigmatella hybrida TaxID=394097 RepID=UPI001CDA9426|nr:DUF3800 domain-containing protein [Stigmatella hybrida]
MTTQPLTHILLCDEAGNTGPNFLDPDQVVFVYAGLLIEREKLPELRVAIDEVDSHYPGATEKKGKALTKDDRGRKILAGFLRAVLDMGGKPVYSVIEKKFALSGRMVERFFNPAVNPGARFLAPDDVRERKEIGLVLANLPDYYVNIFVEAYRTPSEDTFRKSIKALMRAMKSQHRHYLAKALAGNLLHLPELVASELADTPIWGRRNKGISINVGAFFSFLQITDTLTRSIGNPPTEVLHHQIDSLESALRIAWDYGKTSKPSRVLNDGKEVRYGLPALQSIRFVGASAEKAIRGADFLAAAVGVLLDLCARRKPWGSEFDEVAALVAPALHSGGICHAEVSPGFHQQFAEALSAMHGWDTSSA